MCELCEGTGDNAHPDRWELEGEKMDEKKGKKRWGIPFEERSYGMLWIEADTKEEALKIFDEDAGVYDHMDYCGKCETDFEREKIEEG